MSSTAQLALGAALVALVLAVAGVVTLARGRAQRRMLISRLTEGAAVDEQPAGHRRHFTALDRRLRRTGAGRRLERKLAATGLTATPAEFLLAVAAAAAALWLLAGSLLAPFFGPLAALLGLLGAHTYLDRQRRRRTEEFTGQLPELARILANATAAGLALRTALGIAAEELDAPAGDELARVTSQLAVGHSTEDALNELSERLPARELTVLVTTLVLANRSGGAIVTSLRNLTTTLEERKETRREVRTMLAEVNATAFTVPVLGLGAMLMMNSMMPGALAAVTGSVGGQLAMVAAVGLFAAGFFVIRRLGRIEV